MGRKKKVTGKERRKFVRLNYAAPLALKVCKKETVSKILNGYTADVSQAGLLCTLKEKVKVNDILWLSFDRATLTICEDIEKNSFIYQGGIVGKVIRVTRQPDGSFSVGVQFMTREEKNLTNIVPQINYLRRRRKAAMPTTEAQEEDQESEPIDEMEIGDRRKKEKSADEEGKEGRAGEKIEEETKEGTEESLNDEET